jgi:hypothetical protein
MSIVRRRLSIRLTSDILITETILRLFLPSNNYTMKRVGSSGDGFFKLRKRVVKLKLK